MASLRELQAGWRAALLLHAEDAVADEVLADGLSADARLAIYRHHVFTSLTDALETTFPVVCRLVDRRFFGWLADRYVRERPPTTPCLFEYGADFADFIEAFPACTHLPWLGDVARLEWAMNVALHAPDGVLLAPQALATPRPIELRLRLHPSVTLLASRWPVNRIWHANQAATEVVDVVDLDIGGVRLEIRRIDDDVVFRALAAGTFAFRAGLAAGRPLEAAVASAVAAEATFDLATEVRALLDERLLIV